MDAAMEVAAFFLGKYKQGSLICRGGTPWPPLVALAWRELQNRSKQKNKTSSRIPPENHPVDG